VVRKHARRAVKAAFALALAIPIVLGGTANANTGATPTITVGTKNFTEAFVLGQLYKQALEAKGFKVAYKENIGSSELIDTALTSGKINFYPEYTGIIALNLAHAKAPKTAAANYAAAKAFEEKRGFTLLKQTPFSDSDSFAVLKKTATKYGLKTISDLKKVPNLSYGGYPECDKRITCLLGMKKIYGLTKIKFVQLGTIPVTKLIDSGNAGRFQEARLGARLEVREHGERAHRQADQRGDDRDEQGGRRRQEEARRGCQGLPEGKRTGVARLELQGQAVACPCSILRPWPMGSRSGTWASSSETGAGNSCVAASASSRSG
jgi:hypothetical protein